MKNMNEILIKKAQEILDKQKLVAEDTTLYLKYQDEFELLMEVLNEYLER